MGHTSGARRRSVLSASVLGIALALAVPTTAYAEEPVPAETVAPAPAPVETSRAPEVAPAEPTTPPAAEPADETLEPAPEPTAPAEQTAAPEPETPDESVLRNAASALAQPAPASRFGTLGSASGVRPTALTTGHIDLFEVTYDAEINGLRMSIKDDTRLYSADPVFRDPTEVTVYVDSGVAATPLSGLPAAFDFLRSDGATTAYLLPQTQSQSPTLPWPGWSTERLRASLPAGFALASGSPVSLAVEIDGPGNVYTWQNGAFGGVGARYIDTFAPAPDVIPIAASAHVHTNWAFTQLGDYTITVTPSAKTMTGTFAGPSVRYSIHVGPAADAAPQATLAPTLAGEGATGETLTVDTGSWLPTPHATSIAWVRDGALIDEASGTSYTVTEDDEGRRISARVTATVGGQPTTVDTAAIPIGDPGEQPSEADAEPIDDGELTGQSRGDVTVTGGTSFLPGSAFTVALGEEFAGAWVSPWVHSDPIWLGWTQVSDTGTLALRVPASLDATTHRVVVKDRQGALIGWAPLAVEAPAPPPVVTPPVTTPANPTAPVSQCRGGATILSAGHIDYATRIVNGKLESYIGDDTGGPKVYREPSSVVMWLKPSSAVTLPAGMGAVGPAGSRVWQVPLTQNGDLIWLGWSTEALNAGNAVGPVAWSLDRVSGPGTVKIYTTGSFGGVTMILPGVGTTSIPLGVHVHANWAFSAEGIYRLQFTQTATLANGQRSSDTEIVTIAVGDVDPASAGGSGCGGIISAAALRSGDASSAAADGTAVAAAQADAIAAQPTRNERADGAEAGEIVDPITALTEGDPVPMLLTVLGGLLLLGAAGTCVLWFRRRGSA